MDELPRFGPWQALERLGEGGACVVWRASDVEGREVAVKVLQDDSPASVARFVDEAALLRRIDHDNVIRVYDLDAEARPPWLSMELLSGRDLDEEREAQPLEPERAARLIADVAGGLAAVHALGVRHRDIKPANVMVGNDGVPRLIDFGIARRITDTHRTRTGMVVGTAAYLPPEVYTARDPQQAQDTETADVYALGQTLCELLTGVPVYEREGDTTLLVRIMRDKTERPHLDPRQWRPVPDGLAQIVREATRLDPRSRLQTAEELQQRLEAWLGERRTGTPAPVSASLPPPPPGPPQDAHERLPHAVALLGSLSLLALAGAGLVGLWVARPQPASPEAIHAAVESRPEVFLPCLPLREARMTATFVAREGRARDVTVSGGDDATARCVASALGRLDLPPGTLAVSVPLRLGAPR